MSDQKITIRAGINWPECVLILGLVLVWCFGQDFRDWLHSKTMATAVAIEKHK